MKLLKFGGTSLANAEKFLHVSEIIEKNNKSEKIAVVLSAPAKVTNYLSLIIEKIIQNKKMSENEVLEIINLTETLFFKLIKNILKIQSNFSYQAAKEAIKKEFYHLKNIIHGVNLLEYCPDKIKAIIISKGEILSVCIMQTILQSKNYNITIIDPVKNLISTGSYLESTVNIDETKKRISKIIIKKNSIILMSGFIAGNQKNELVVLGRNGSDYSAAVLAACFNANSCEIWTDVDGVFTCDPRITSNAHLLKSISYEETMELSYFGAKVLHPRTIEPLAQFKIPCFIKNTNNITFPGTIISDTNQSEKNFLKGVTHLNNIAMLNVSGVFIKLFENIITRIFNIILRNHIKVILMTQSSSDKKISFCILQDKISTFLNDLNEEFRLELENTTLNPFELKNNLSIIAVIGSNIYKKNNVTSKIFSCLETLKINVITIAQGSSKHSISIVIKTKHALKAVKNIHNVLFYNKKIIHIFLIGIGGIGKTLLKQIFIQKNFLSRKNIEIKICLIANSKKLLFSTNTINLSNWKELFQQSKEKFTLESLEKIMKNNNFTNSVLVDCTSDQILSEKYINFLHHDFHVVTSNKKANTNKWSYYYKIKNTAFKKNKKFLYETNVGAGLPVIETIQNLINTGDYLIYFTGILSGSLSFIFGKLEENIPLSQAVQEAMDLGFTEPDPRDDLSGMDVARKLLILAREFGYKTELHEIKVEPLLPKIFKKYNNLDHFFIELKNLDLHFLERMKKARDFGKVLRFIGTIESTGKCFVRIEEVDINNPLYKVKNGENALAFYTNYYKSIPLVLRGYGAGKNVTASGVFSDLLRTLS